MYVVSTNGIILYEGIDKSDKQPMQPKPLYNDYVNWILTPNAVDCTASGTIVFDLKAINNQH